MALAVPAALDLDRDRAQNSTVEVEIHSQMTAPAATDFPEESGIPPETRMLAFVMVYMLAVSIGVGALIVRLW